MTKGLPNFSDATYVRDSLDITYERRLKPGSFDEYELKPIMTLAYHADVTSPSTGADEDFRKAFLNPIKTAPSLQIGKKNTGTSVVCTYKGEWNVERISVEQQGDVARVSFVVTKEGKWDTPSVDIDDEIISSLSSTFTTAV